MGSSLSILFIDQLLRVRASGKYTGSVLMPLCASPSLSDEGNEASKLGLRPAVHERSLLARRANMFSVETDRSKRLLVISMAGHVTKQDVRQAAEEVREVLQDVAPEFRALTDFRWLESIH